jgi:hypothetical protein
MPIMIQELTVFENFKTKSEVQGAVMNRNFFFMIIFLIYMPLMGLVQLRQFFITLLGIDEKAFENKDVITQIWELGLNFKPDKWPFLIARNMLNRYNYFDVMIIQLAFVSVGFWLLDLSHLITVSLKKCLHNRA